jgi:hypothetical protein
MYNYIKEQWIDSQFCRWQSFRNLPGYANTNSNLESFNETIKRDFTNKRVSHIFESLSKIAEIITYYSDHQQEFFTTPKYNKNVFEKTKSLTKKNYSFVDSHNVIYRGLFDPVNIIFKKKTKEFFCECCAFMKHGICKHLVGFSNLFDLNLIGPEWSNKPKTFAFNKKRGRERKTNRYGEVNKKIK